LCFLLFNSNIYYSINSVNGDDTRMLGVRFGIEKLLTDNLIIGAKTDLGYNQISMDFGLYGSIGYKIPIIQKYILRPYTFVGALYQVNNGKIDNIEEDKTKGLGYGGGILLTLNKKASISLETSVYNLDSKNNYKYVKNILSYNLHF